MDKWDIVIFCSVLLSISGLMYIDILQDEKINTYSNTIELQKQLIDDYSIQINNTYFDLVMYQFVLKDVELENQQLIKDVQNYKDIIVYKDDLYANKKGTVRKPTYVEVVEFLENDETNRKEWTNEYDCTQFAHEIIRNAREYDIYGCIVTIDYTNKKAHDIIVFDTSDAGIQYFEPQNDANVYMYLRMDYAGYLGYPDDVHLIVRQYDSCYERVL